MSETEKNSTKIIEDWRSRVGAVIQVEGVWISSVATVIHHVYGYGSRFFSNRVVRYIMY